MKKVSFLVIIFIIACNSGLKTESSNNTKNVDLKKMVSITDDQFIIDAIENDTELNNIETVCHDFFKEYKTVKNKYSERLDTVTFYFKNSDTVAIYSTVDKKFITKMNINTDKIGFLKNTIKIGLIKTYFSDKYSTIKSSDIFEICNTEGFICMQFTITNGKLSNIKYRSNYMD